MGSLIGRAATLNGDNIVVTFGSKHIDSTEELMISSINIQCDGSGDYTALKITTASVAVVTDGLALIESLTRVTTYVTIKNESKGSILFNGYVVPNSLNQSYKGVNDVITIECVDQLGYTQYLNYTQSSPDNGFAVLTIAEVVTSIATLVGITTVAVPGSVALRNPDTGARTTSFTQLTLSEELFFAQSLPDISVINDDSEALSYMPYAKTCRQVLEMISESFRLTWIQVGETLYLYDSVCQPSYKNLSSGVFIFAKQPTEISEESLRDGDCVVSQLPGYSRIKIKHESVDEINLLPDPFNQEYLSDFGQVYQTYESDSDDDTIIRATRLFSELFYFPSFTSSSGLECTPVAWKEVQGWRGIQGTLLTDRNDVYKNGGWSTAIKIRDTGEDTSRRVMMSLNLPYMQATVASGNTYIYPEIEMTVSKNDRLYPYKDEQQSLHLWASLEIGGMFYDIKANSYSSGVSRFLMTISKNGDCVLSLDNASVGYNRKGIPVKHGGPVCFTIYSRAGQNLGWENAWIKKLKLNLRRGYAEERILPPVEYYGTFTEPGKDLDVSLPIDMYNTLSKNRFGTIINGVDYRSSGKIELLFSNGGEEMTMPHYIYRQMNPGNGLSYTLKLNDEYNSICIGDRFTSALWDGDKTVVGIEKDIIDNIVTVTLI